jgi:hypothetical protein
VERIFVYAASETRPLGRGRFLGMIVAVTEGQAELEAESKGQGCGPFVLVRGVPVGK